MMKQNKEHNYYEELLKTAANDLKAARFLYNEHQYPQAIFSLQQSAEKTYKAFWGSVENASQASLKNIGHNTFKKSKRRFIEESKKFLEKMELFKDYPQLQNLFNVSIGDFKIDFNSAYALVKAQNELVTTLEKLDANQIVSQTNSIITGLWYPLNKFHKEFIKLLKGKFAVEAHSILTNWYIDISNMANLKDDANFQKMMMDIDSPEFKRMFPKFLRMIADLLMCIFKLELISSLLSPHVSRTRYPENNLSPKKIYTGRHPLIRHFNEFADALDEIIKCYRKFLFQPLKLPK